MAEVEISQDELVTGKILNQRQIPQVKFVENVESFVGKKDPVKYVQAFQDLHAKYKYSESSLVTQIQNVKSKLPDIENGKNVVEWLIEKKNDNVDSAQVTYQLSENVWSNAEIEPTRERILLWLGASVMLEYTYDEAKELLTKNFKNANLQLTTSQADLEFLKEQIVTTEVNIARCHNYGVVQRAAKRAEEEEKKA